MTTKTLGWLVGFGALLSFGLACSQPKPDCVVASATTRPFGAPGILPAYVARYTVAGTPPECASAPKFIKKVELIGLQYYHPVAEGMGHYDPSVGTVALKGKGLGDKVAQAAKYMPPIGD